MNHLASSNCPENSLSSVGRKKLIVIGGGPVGVKFANELSEVSNDFEITVFSDEINEPYQRARLSQLLAGQIDRAGVDMALIESETTQLIYRKVVSVYPESKNLVDSENQRHNFDYLVFALGSRAFVPNINGVNLDGVFHFRSMNDTELLLARKVRARHVVVVGGGLLGIETAVAMNRYNTKVSIVHQGEWLLNRLMDEPASKRLERRLDREGIQVYLNNGVRGIHGSNNKVELVKFRNGLELNCDSVILCCGTSPNIELARDAKIRVNRGIVVSDTLETSVEGVFAIGECCEHNEKNYGLIGPGYDQASVLADRFAGYQAVYKGSSPQNLLKVLDFPIKSFGSPVGYVKSPFIRTFVHETPETYFKVVSQKGTILGSVALGKVEEYEAVYDAYLRKEPLPWYRGILLRVTGKLWPLNDQNEVDSWADQRVVCRCRQVSLKTIRSALTEQVTTLEQIGLETQAGVTCGSCQSALLQILEHKTGKTTFLKPAPLFKTSASIALLSIIAAVLLWVIPGLTTGDSVSASAPLEHIWNSKFWKQFTGYTLLGVSIAGLAVSLRKRVNWNLWGKFVYWRFAHTVMGALCVAILMIHTGLHTGSNLNNWLAINYSLVLVLGAITSFVMAYTHKLRGPKQELIRKSWNWLHIIAIWPLPILLAAHIITVYKY